MTRYNFDLSRTQRSNRRPLTPDEEKYLATCFSGIASAILDDVVPDHIVDAMGDIETQLRNDGQLSDAQINYVQGVYEKYYLGIGTGDYLG